MSTIPTRRAGRVTRSSKDNENVNARPSRLATRTKVVATTTTAAAGPTGFSRATAPTAASTAKSKSDPKADLAAGKRKREALGEVTGLVTNNNKVKNVAVKGKEKFDGVVISKIKVGPRQPLRTVASAAANVVVEVEKEDVKVHGDVVHDDNAMVIDEPTIAPLRKLPVRRPRLSKEASTVVTRSSLSRPHASPRIVHKPIEEDPEVSRISKKRRTSSEAPDADILDEERLHEESEAVAAARIASELEACGEAEVDEADPEGSQWDDLDAEDSDDPVMVSEYVVEIFKYLKVVEQTTMPNPNYMESQKELAWKMRGILTDWLIQVHVRFRLLPETLFLCVNIIDRFLSARVVSLAKLQLVGVTCMFIAAKFEEVMAPSVTEFLVCADSSYTESEILKAERYVLKTLDWNLSYPNPVHFLRRVSKADEYDVKVRTLAKFLLEIGCLEWRLIAAPPSLMAAASIWLARLALGREIWTPNLAHYSSYPESALVPTANLMLNYILKPIKHESFYKKYAAKKFLKSSIFMREWALERWTEGTQVSLNQVLPELKAVITEQRLQEETELAEAEWS